MVKPPVGAGSQYGIAPCDSEGTLLDRAKTYHPRVPPNVPACRSWDITVYDNMTRSMLQVDEPFGRGTFSPSLCLLLLLTDAPQGIKETQMTQSKWPNSIPSDQDRMLDQRAMQRDAASKCGSMKRHSGVVADTWHKATRRSANAG